MFRDLLGDLDPNLFVLHAPTDNKTALLYASAPRAT
jgi:hypothetical protein